MPATVVIIAQPDDVHALCVGKRIETEHGAEAIIVDAADYPEKWQLTWMVENGVDSSYRLTVEGVHYEGEQITGVWWRRVRRHVIPQSVTDPRVRQFSVDEAKAAFQGWIYSLGDKVVNPLMAEYAAHQKPYQLHHASMVGLRIPRTVVTNDATEVIEFHRKEKGNVIFKVLTGTDFQFTETRTLEEDYISKLENLKFAPAIFQEKIVATADIRVTIVGDELFPVSIHPQHPGASLDWRLDIGAEIQPHTLPDDIAKKLIALQQALGIKFGAVDLRLTEGGEYVFLEVNPAGQWLFAEIHGQQKISSALARKLLETK